VAFRGREVDGMMAGEYATMGEVGLEALCNVG